MSIKSEYTDLIDELDQTLSLVRDFWMQAGTPTEREKQRVRLDKLLDRRIALMRCRDAFQSAAA